MFDLSQFMIARELGMRDGFAGGSAVRYMDSRPQLPDTGEWRQRAEGTAPVAHVLTQVAYERGGMRKWQNIAKIKCKCLRHLRVARFLSLAN